MFLLSIPSSNILYDGISSCSSDSMENSFLEPAKGRLDCFDIHHRNEETDWTPTKWLGFSGSTGGDSTFSTTGTPPQRMYQWSKMHESSSCSSSPSPPDLGLSEGGGYGAELRTFHQWGASLCSRTLILFATFRFYYNQSEFIKDHGHGIVYWRGFQRTKLNYIAIVSVSKSSYCGHTLLYILTDD